MTFVPGRSQKSFLVLVSSINDKLLLDGGGLNNCSRKLGPAFSFLSWSCVVTRSDATHRLFARCNAGLDQKTYDSPRSSSPSVRHFQPNMTLRWRPAWEEQSRTAAIQAQSSSQAGTFIKCPKMSKSAKMLAKMSGFFNWTSEDDLFFLVHCLKMWILSKTEYYRK